MVKNNHAVFFTHVNFQIFLRIQMFFLNNIFYHYSYELHKIFCLLIYLFFYLFENLDSLGEKKKRKIGRRKTF